MRTEGDENDCVPAVFIAHLFLKLSDAMRTGVFSVHKRDVAVELRLADGRNASALEDVPNLRLGEDWYIGRPVNDLGKICEPKVCLARRAVLAV